LLIVISLVCPACSIDAPAPPESEAAGFDPGELDPRQRPQDSLFDHVNARWLEANSIPPEWSAWGVTHELEEKTEDQLYALIEDIATSPGEDPDRARIAALYASFMDQDSIEAAGVDPLEPGLRAIDAARSHADVWRLFGSLFRLGVDTPVQFYTDAAADNPDRVLLYFWQSGLGMPDRDYYLLDDDSFAALRADYAAHVQSMHELAGLSEPTASVATILSLETRIARVQWPSEANRDRERIYSNRFTPAQAAELAPQIDWTSLIEGLGASPPGEFVVAQDDYFVALGRLVGETPVAAWRTYLRFKLLKAYADYLPEAVEAEHFAFEGTALRGQEQRRPRWRRAVELVNNNLGEPLGRLYVERHFPASAKVRVEAMVENIREAYRERIRDLEWMTPATRAAAEAKLDRFVAKLGFPDVWRDYRGLDLEPGNLVGNVVAARTFAHDHEVAKLDRPTDRSEWGMPPQTINAYYRSTYNEIVFPAAILQPPMFDPAVDDAINYGAIGAVIGHEFSHGFDDQGRKFDGDGRLRDWWTPADERRYVEETSALVAQYDRFEALPGLTVNGRLTLGENIGDLAGATMALRAWERSLDGHAPIVIDGFTGAQRFFIGYAISWRTQTRPERARELLLSDPHAPARFRVDGVVRNMPEFHAAFATAPGDELYLPPEDRIRIW
jgi:predicted metalloendopeptidase